MTSSSSNYIKKNKLKYYFYNKSLFYGQPKRVFFNFIFFHVKKIYNFIKFSNKNKILNFQGFVLPFIHYSIIFNFIPIKDKTKNNILDKVLKFFS